MADFSKPPASAKLPITPFKAHVDQQKIDDFRTLLRLSPVAPPNFENSDPAVTASRYYGVPRDWILHAKDFALNQFDWRKAEDRINNDYHNFTAQVPDDLGNELTIHFIALFSQREDAVPIVFYHGWPGSFLEFTRVFDLLKTKYSPANLPYHVIAPSLPGYAYSSGPPLRGDYGLENASAALANLATGLFPQGYYAQGGDLGSMISRLQAGAVDLCKGMHVNFASAGRPENADSIPLSDLEIKGLQRAAGFGDHGSGYALEHGTRTATIGHVLSSSPVALLTWIGEKWLEWTDEDPALEQILELVTIYWMTDTFPRCIYPYRGITRNQNVPRRLSIMMFGKPRQDGYISKPSGFSYFPREVAPTPVSWVATTCNLVSSRVHTSGGHFAALEKPKELLEDVEEYVQKAEKSGKA